MQNTLRGYITLLTAACGFKQLLSAIQLTPQFIIAVSDMTKQSHG